MFRKQKTEENHEDQQEFEPRPEIQPEMQQTIVVEAKEKVKKHTAGKIITGLIAGAVLGVAVYSVCMRIVFNTMSSNSINSFILLDGMNYNQTNQTLSKFGKDMRKEIKDYGLIGTKLFLSHSKITPKTVENNTFLNKDLGYTDIGLYDILHHTKKDVSTNFEQGKNFLDLGKLSEGNYLVYPYRGDASLDKDSDYHFFSFASTSPVYETFYSLPNNVGERRRITLQNNSASPYTIIKVKDCGDALPSDVYDFVLYYKQYEGEVLKETSQESITKLNTMAENLTNNHHFKVKVCSTLEEAVNTKATYSFAVTGDTLEKGITSFYTTFRQDNIETEVFQEGELQGYDKLPEIRETTGYLDKGGQGYLGIVGNSIPVYEENRHIGKESFLVHDEIENICSILLKK